MKIKIDEPFNYRNYGMIKAIIGYKCSGCIFDSEYGCGSYLCNHVEYEEENDGLSIIFVRCE
jgi:hypothetical protein